MINVVNFTSSVFFFSFFDIPCNNQTLNWLHETVIDYDYFQLMKEDYDYVFVFASGVITFRLWLQILCLITITKLFDYDYNKFMCILIPFLLQM